MLRNIQIIFLFLCVTFLPVASFGQGDNINRDIRTVSGTVDTVDWVASTVVVKWYDLANGGFDEVSIFVPDDVPITRGQDTIGLADLNQGGWITIDYINTSPGPLKAVKALARAA